MIIFLLFSWLSFLYLSSNLENLLKYLRTFRGRGMGFHLKLGAGPAAAAEAPVLHVRALNAVL